MQLDAILFDFDGTLFDTIHLIVESYQYMYRKHKKREHSADEIKSGIGLPLEEVIIGEYPEDGPAMLETYLEYSNKRASYSYGIFLGIGPMLEGLKEEGIPFGIVTAKRFNQAKAALETSGLEDYFDCLVTKFDTEIHKPNPAPLNVGMKKLGFEDPSRIIYVGDAIFDVQAAKNGDFISAAVAWTQIKSETLKAENPDIWLEKPEDLVSIVKYNYKSKIKK